jgi:phosphate transport system substrate-binding protein
MFAKVRNIIFILAALALVLAACGGQDTAPATDSGSSAPADSGSSAPADSGSSAPADTDEILPIVLPYITLPDEVTGDIITAGSSTVFPVSERMAELFQQEGYTGNITVDMIGSGAGYERFCTAGESDIANASRPIKSSEVEDCRAIGREPLEFRVGTDALAVVVSTENDFLTSISLEDLGKVFSGEYTNWNQVDASYPDGKITLYSPGTDSGTFDYFVEEVLGKDPAGLLGVEGVQLSEDDNVLVNGVVGDPFAIGYFGYAYYAENTSRLKALSLNDIEPNQANVDAATYPLARPLFIFSDAKIMQEKPQVAAFIAFYLSQLDDNIVDVGYFPAPKTAIYQSWGAWLAAVGGVEVNADMVSGDIITAGSSTVFPVSERMAELFQQEGYTGNITVDSIGSGAGYERFCVAGETDIANASRPIKSSEVEDCRAIGREPLEFRVGTDALAVVVSTENDFLTSISLEDLGKVFSGEYTNWNQVDASYPDGKITLYSPGTDSGTFDYFVEEVLGKDPAGLLGVEGVQLSEDDNVLVNGVVGDPFAIGYFGYAYYAENTSRLKALSLNGVEPSQANVDNGTYPLARPLFIFSDAKIMQEKPQVAAFIGFYLSQLDDNIVDVGYFPAPATAIYQSWGAWFSAVLDQ